MSRPENDLTSKRRLSLVGSKTFAVSIPIEIIKQLKLKKGDELFVRRIGKRIIVEKGE